MPRFPSTGKVRVSSSAPTLNFRQRSVESEVKYYGLLRDKGLSDIEKPLEALSEVLKDIQDPSEALTEGLFSREDLDIIEGITKYNLKTEDFNILTNASLDVQRTDSSSSALVNPRQRISDRIKQLESFIGRGTLYAGQGTTMFKYVVPTSAKDSFEKLYSHSNPPPFFTEPITSSVENAADFIPSTPEELTNTHRVGAVVDGKFIPDKESEYWWSGEYNFDFGDFRGEIEFYTLNSEGGGSDVDPEFPIVKNGNLSYRTVRPKGIPDGDNWGLRFDTWMKVESLRPFARFIAQVHGHLKIDFFEKTGYNPTTKAIEGFWRTALDTSNPQTYFVEDVKEIPSSSSVLGYRRIFIQGGPSVDYGLGTGTKPDYATRASNGGVVDYSTVYESLEGETLNAFNDGFVPVIIRFWYGQQDQSGIDENSTPQEILNSKPTGPASLLIQYITSEDYANWNDYSSRIHLKRIGGEWIVQGDGIDTSLSNFNSAIEVHAYKLSATNPDGLEIFNPINWTLFPSFVPGYRKDNTSTTTLLVDIPGYSPSNGDDMWVVLRNRAASYIPYNTTFLELWQKNLFDPNPRGSYLTARDLLEGVGSNYEEPDPSKVTFEDNPGYYKAKHGRLPALNVYDATRYDGTLLSYLTLANDERDYDYEHDKLLFIGRQKKSTSVKPLQPGEIRKPGANYTFFEVVSDENGNGGNIIINAYPANNMGILAAGSSGVFGKALHLSDNTKTFSNPSRQNIQKLSVNKWPTTPNFDSTQAIKVREGADGQIYMYVVTGSGTTYNTYDTSGLFSTNTFGAGATRNHDIKQIYLSGFKKSNGSGTGSEHYFYGLIGGIRQSLRNIELSTSSGSSTQIISEEVFPDIIGTSSYNGTQIEFKDGSDGDIIATAYVTSFNSSTNEVTYIISSGSVLANTSYFVDIWFNHLRFISLPSAIVDNSGVRQTASSHITEGSNIQISYVYSGGYQYSRADGGSGLNFSETLFFIGDDSDPVVTESSPFLGGTEIPAPPADIVTPFGYDNSPSDPDPGLGGLCYPPYRTQNIGLFSTAITTSVLESKPIGQFDIWWGSKDNLTNLGGKQLEITNKLLFDFDSTQRSTLLTEIPSNDKPTFKSSTYTHKLEIELNVEVPAGPVENTHIYKDVQKYSNGKTVKDRYFLFIRKSNETLEVLSPTNPQWI